jgi:hypothetical protein
MGQQRSGHVYVLVSPKSEFVKIGGTDFPPNKRIREINAALPYRDFGPWHLLDFRQVTDWRKVEYHMHYIFRGYLVSEIAGQRELFRVAPQRVSAALGALDPELIVRQPTVDRMFQDTEFSNYILKLFAFTGLLNWLDIQGSWTFVLFPQTAGGRYFTLNIGRHEVAYSGLPKHSEIASWHSIVMDRLIYDFTATRVWVRRHGGEFEDDSYASALPRSVSVHFKAGLDGAMEFLKLDGVRRALIAYWAEALIGMKERGSSSLYARYHNWNAVAEIRMRLLSAVQ